MQKYKHFIGVTSSDEVKTKYKELVKIHHPDTGGNEDIFKELLKEYTYIKDNISHIVFPIAVQAPNMAEAFGDIMDGFAWASEKADRDRPDTTPPNMTEEEYYWYKRKPMDDNFAVLDDIIDIYITEKKSDNWFISEVVKLDKLGIEHFKYIKHVMKKRNPEKRSINDDWVNFSYKNYVVCKNVEV